MSTPIDEYGQPEWASEEKIHNSAVARDDLVTLYLRDVARVELLTAEEEVSLAKRMEAGKLVPC